MFRSPQQLVRRIVDQCFDELSEKTYRRHQTSAFHGLDAFHLDRLTVFVVTCFAVLPARVSRAESIEPDDVFSQVDNAHRRVAGLRRAKGLPQHPETQVPLERSKRPAEVYDALLEVIAGRIANVDGIDTLTIKAEAVDRSLVHPSEVYELATLNGC